MLAVEEAQHEAQEKAEASTVSSPGLKILAPDPEAPSQTAIRFDVPKTDAGEATLTPRAAATTPDEPPITTSAELLPSATQPPTAAMPAPGTLPEAGEIGGALIRELREGRGLSIDEVADATKIRKPYLKAIEEEDIPNLPARVYLRGFLTQVARVLKVDRNRLAEGYLQLVERKAS